MNEKWGIEIPETGYFPKIYKIINGDKYLVGVGDEELAKRIAKLPELENRVTELENLVEGVGRRIFNPGDTIDNGVLLMVDDYCRKEGLLRRGPKQEGE